MIEKLKTCPKCGGEAWFEMSKPEGGRVRVHCSKCKASTAWHKGFDYAARAWNMGEIL